MTTDPVLERQEAHAFLDQLPPEKLSAVRGLLERMLDPIDRKLALAPFDDEPETEEQRLAAAIAVESLDRTGGVPMEAVLADFGLTMDDFQSMAQRDPADDK
jgi:hypothetical protein